jgi:hypothetical protein
MSSFVSPWKLWAATAAGRRVGCILASLVMLIPCYWQPRLHAADLSSRMDYGWFTQWIESGRWQGVTGLRQTTYALFDGLSAGWVRMFGAEIGERLCVSMIVLVFVWGAFAFVSVVSGQRPWHLLPSIAMLAYGWVFHMGFFNFYLSLGLCFWVLALVCDTSPRRCAMAVPLLVLAYTAHPLPVAWTLCLAVYLWLGRRGGERVRRYASAASLLLIVLCFFAAGRTVYGTGASHVALPAPAGQVWIFDSKYDFVLVGLLLVWGLLFLDLLRQWGARRIVSSAAFQICVISAAVVVLLPATILLPGFDHALVYVAERMSLGVGVCVCALLGIARPRAFERWALVAVALVFFVFVHRDERSFNSFQDQMQDTIAQTMGSEN